MTFARLGTSLVILATLLLGGCGVALDRKADRNESAAEAAYPPQGRFVEVGGRRVHVVVEGSGPDLVLIHGASGNARDFTFRFVDAVKDRYRVLVFDRPGLGYTDRVDDRYAGATTTRAESPAEQAILLQAAAAQLGATRPIVLGQSYGGAVAMAWALERPRNLSALVIVSGATEPWPGGLAPTYPLLASRFGGTTLVPVISAVSPLDKARASLDAIFAPQDPPAGYDDYVGIPLALRRETLRANARQVNGLRPHLVEMSKRYGSVDVPTEILHGTADTVVGYEIHAVPLSRQIPGARLTPLRGIGHMPHHVAQDAVVAAIDRAAARAGLR